MTSRIITVALAACLAAGLGSATPLATAADPVSEFHLTDPAGDAHFTYDSDRDPVTAPDVDVVALDVERLPDRLVVRLSYADLRPNASRDWGLFFWMNRGHHKLYVDWSRTHDYSGWHEGGAITRILTDEEEQVRCPALRGRPDYETDVLTLRVPARCFGDPDGIVLKGITASARFDDPDAEKEDSPFGDPEQPFSTRTPRLMDPA